MLRALSIVLVLSAILAGAVTLDRPLPRAELTIIDSQDFITLDPQRATYLQDLRACACLYEGLTRSDTRSPGFEPVPALARSWQLSADRLTYTFHLDPRARWSNGEGVTAGDVVYAWKRMMLPDTAADYSSMFMVIRGAKEFFEHRQAELRRYRAQPASGRTREAAAALRRACDAWFDANVGLSAADEHTLVVTLVRPVAYFLDLCAFAPFSPVHPATVERFVSLDPVTGELRQDHGWTKPGSFVGNGPMVLTGWRFKREARLDANPYYRDPDALKTRSVSIRPIEDQNTGILAFESGAADWHADVNADYIPEMLAQVKRGERDDFAAFPTFGTYFWNFNCEPRLRGGRANPFADARVRRAFAHCVDKRALVENVKRGGERAVNVLVPPGSIAGYESPEGIGFDPAQGARELASAGWSERGPGGVPARRTASGLEPFPVVELLVTPIQYHKDVAQALGRMWEQSLGIRTTISVCESKTFKERLRGRDYMISRANWWGDYGDPTSFLNLHRTGDGNNDRGYSNPEYDALLDGAERAADPGERLKLLSRAEAITTDVDLPVLPLWQNNFYYMFRPSEKNGVPYPGGLRGITTHPRMVQYYWQVEVVR